MASVLVHTRKSPAHDSPCEAGHSSSLKPRVGFTRKWSDSSHEVLPLLSPPSSHGTDDQRVCLSVVTGCAEQGTRLSLPHADLPGGLHDLRLAESLPH